ncbi:MAG TPA: hypothetical protein VLJ61_03595 [Pyrinomonadaceae bacterium]|nr:hypothetical protein [Pyrinomonadaceae bacterium]
MADLRTAPNYCYHDKKVRLMGWSAHGNICGGFKPGTTDDVIRQALFETAENKVEEYPEARHFIYFATTRQEGDAEETVVYCTAYEKGAE